MVAGYGLKFYDAGLTQMTDRACRSWVAESLEEIESYRTKRVTDAVVFLARSRI